MSSYAWLVTNATQQSVSRVGKVPGNRSRNKRARTSSEQPDSQSPEAAESSTRESTKELAPDSSAFSLYDDLYVDWANMGEHREPYDLSGFDGDINGFLGCQETERDVDQASRHTGSDFPTPSPSDFSLNMLSLGLTTDSPQSPSISNDCDNLSASTNVTKHSAALHRQQRGLQQYPNTSSEGRIQVSTPPYLPSPPYTQERRHGNSGRCISACTKIIEYLDIKIHDDSIALDEVMRVNKASVCEIARIMNVEGYKESTTCPLLISIAMGQIVTLFESSIRSKGFPSNSLSASPRLRFGSFQVDPEEQIALRAHIICKELRRSIQALKTLSFTLRNPSTQAAQSVTLHKQWSADMTRRLEALIAAVEER
ncbi:MAG: hypothetical protein M1830_001318 [Pleopsidium flavum]|nr:MAG: hypothetical protein M1830_001318 [Pleopsidium flavum]